MKKLVKLLSIVTMAAAGAFAFVNATNKTSQEVETVSAENMSAGTKIYFTPSNRWAADSATFKLQWYKNGGYVGSAFMDATSPSVGKLTSRTTYVASPTAQFDAVQILRFNPQKSTQWNYSNNSSLVSGCRHLIMDANCSWDNTWAVGDGSNTVWRSVDVNLKRTDQSASASTTRLFIYNSGSHFNPVAIRATGGGASPTVGGAAADATIYHPSWVKDDNNTYYGYCDVPVNVTNFKVINCAYEDSYDAYANYYSDDEFTIANHANRVFYCPGDGNKVTVGGAHDDYAGSKLMEAVIAAVNTCSSNAYNGYGAYSNLDNFFYSHATAAAKAYSCKSLGGSTSFTVQEHFDGMASKVSRGASSGSPLFGVINENTQNITIIVLVSLVSVTAIGGYFFIRRRKENN